MEGVATACADFQMPLLGGDSGSHETSVLSAAAFGICKRGTGLLRAGGRAGDRLFLTGTVGLAGAAYAYFKAESKGEGRLTEDEIAVLLAPWRRVEPALQQGASLAETGCSRCAIDTSDGLLVSAARLASASGVDVVISEQSIPTHPAVDHVAEILGIPPRVLACGVSVDFRLLFSSPPERCQELKSLFDANRWPLFEVGYMRTAEAEPSVYFETVRGTRVAQESDYFG
jgi:thiamine-monophosphate kinase